MSKNKYLAALLASSMTLTGCLDDSSSESTAQIDYRDNLSDLELAKDFTNRFGKVGSAISDMQEPMIETSSQFMQDVSNVDGDALEASMEVLDAVLLAAILPVSKAIEIDGNSNFTGINYEKMAGVYYLAQVMDVACEQGFCSKAIDTSTAALLKVNGNVISVENAQISSELFATHSEYPMENGYNEVIVRDESLGQFNNTVSFDITLPEENLGTDNTIAISISNLSLTSADTDFSISIDNLGAGGQFDTNASLTLSDLFTTQEQLTIDKINANLSNAVIEFGSATFKGNLNLNAGEGSVGINVDASVNGELINSKGDSIKAALELGRTEYQYQPSEYQYEYNSNPDGSYNSSDSLNGSESYNFDYSLELVFDSVEHGELAVKLSALGSYEEEKSAASSGSYDGIGSSEYEYKRNYTEELMSNGDIEVRVANETFKVSYDLNTDFKETESNDDSSDNESSSWEHNHSIVSVNAIKITDATYTKRDIYMLIDATTSLSSSFTNLGDSASAAADLTSGVYVGDTLYGELAFNPMNNTQDIVFNDGSKVSLSY